MRRLWICVMVLCLGVPTAFAGRVCVQKSTGKLLEYQSEATPGTLTTNQLRAGADPNDLDEHAISDTDWNAIYEAQVLQSARQAAAAREQQRQQKAQAISQKLGLTPVEFKELREALAP